MVYDYTHWMEVGANRELEIRDPPE
jgi:hypothetical protein